MEDEQEENEEQKVTIIEKKVGKYDCPMFVLSEKEEERIWKPWKFIMIVKLLGRKIGFKFKALETKIQQMWVKKRVTNMIDVGNDNFHQ